MSYLEIRKTRKYVDSYSNLDEWEPVGDYEEIGSFTIEGDDEDYPNVIRHIIVDVTPDGEQSQETIKQALKDNYTQWGCAHEYDCCGCWLWSANVHHIEGNRWYVVRSGSQNY